MLFSGCILKGFRPPVLSNQAFYLGVLSCFLPFLSLPKKIYLSIIHFIQLYSIYNHWFLALFKFINIILSIIYFFVTIASLLVKMFVYFICIVDIHTYIHTYSKHQLGQLIKNFRKTITVLRNKYWGWANSCFTHHSTGSITMVYTISLNYPIREVDYNQRR